MRPLLEEGAERAIRYLEGLESRSVAPSTGGDEATGSDEADHGDCDQDEDECHAGSLRDWCQPGFCYESRDV